MKTIVRKILMLWVVLLSVGSLLAVTYTGSYQRPQKEDARQAAVMATAPSAQFQSTSTLTGSGSAYTPNPTLGSGGTADKPSGAPGGPRRAPDPVSDDNWWTQPENEGETGLDTPVGDGVWPLMLMAVAYVGVVALRRRKAVKR